MFKIRLETPEPNGVKISRKNVCIVTINKSEKFDKDEEAARKLLEFYLRQQDPTWSQQFLNAIMLGPTLDEDDMIV